MSGRSTSAIGALTSSSRVSLLDRQGDLTPQARPHLSCRRKLSDGFSSPASGARSRKWPLERNHRSHRCAGGAAGLLIARRGTSHVAMLDVGESASLVSRLLFICRGPFD